MRTRRSSDARATVALLVIVTMLVSSCASTAPGGPSPTGSGVMSQPGTAALACGLGGAAVGAAIGGAAGRNWQGALIGAAAGALLAATTCFAIADYQSRQVRGYGETGQAIGYQPGQGDVVRITRYELVPAAVAPGGQIAFNATYYVMTPTPDQDVPITETRTLLVRDPGTNQYREVGRAPAQVTVKPGTRQSDGKIPVGSGVAEGNYQLLFEVSKNGVKDTQALPITVTRDRTVLAAPVNQAAQVVAEGGKRVEASTPTAPGARPATPPPPAAAPSAGAPLSTLGEADPKPPGSPTVAATRPAYFVASRVVGRGALREGPGRSYRVVGQIHPGERFPIVERRLPPGEATPWYRLRLDSGLEAWVAGSLGEEAPE